MGSPDEVEQPVTVCHERVSRSGSQGCELVQIHAPQHVAVFVTDKGLVHPNQPAEEPVPVLQVERTQTKLHQQRRRQGAQAYDLGQRRAVRLFSVRTVRLYELETLLHKSAHEPVVNFVCNLEPSIRSEVTEGVNRYIIQYSSSVQAERKCMISLEQPFPSGYIRTRRGCQPIVREMQVMHQIRSNLCGYCYP